MGISCKPLITSRLWFDPRIDVRCTVGVALRFVMKEIMHGKRRPRAVCIAIVTIMAVLTVPFCGVACATVVGCEQNAAIVGSAETCHHAAVSTPLESESAAQASAKSCNRHELPALLSSSQNFSSSKNAVTSALLLSVTHPAQFARLDLVAHNVRWLDDDVPLLVAPPVTSTSILRI